MTDGLDHLYERLRRYGTARNRAADHEPRTVTVSDDEAVALALVLADWLAMTGTPAFGRGEQRRTLNTWIAASVRPPTAREAPADTNTPEGT